MADVELPERAGLLLEKFGESDFRSAAAIRFPLLKEELEEHSALLHPQIHALAECVRSALSEGRTDCPAEVFAFLAEVLSHPRCAPEIQDAIGSSFVTSGELEETAGGRRALDLAPPILREAMGDL